jgi:gamma-glutamylcyclotransferase (GGCT)/AIG2-like uncharacterized protein YtfP
MTRDALFFAYGTLQRGFPNYGPFARDLGEPLGRYRTAEAYPLVVPRRAACANPACRYVHRIGALLQDAGAGVRVEGELFAVTTSALARLDRFESYRADDEAGSAYVRRRIEVAHVEGGDPVEAEVYFVADGAPFRALLARGEADAVARYELEFARGPLKHCCAVDPNHAGPHDVVDPLSLQGQAP